MPSPRKSRRVKFEFDERSLMKIDEVIKSGRFPMEIYSPTSLTPGSLWQAPEGICSTIAPNTTLELTRVERGPSGEVLALTFVPFTGDPIRLILLPETQPQAIRNVSGALDVL